MKDLSYESKGNENYLVYAMDSAETVDNLAKGMLQSNDIDGIISPSFVQMDDKRSFKYDVTAYRPFAEIMEAPVEKKWIVSVILSLLKTAAVLDEYMLSEDGLILDSEYVYFDPKKEAALLVYLPVEKDQGSLSVTEYILHLLSHCRYQENGDISYVGELINILNDPAEKNVRNIEKKIEKSAREPVKTVPRITEPQPAGIQKAVPAAPETQKEIREENIVKEERPVLKAPWSIPVPKEKPQPEQKKEPEKKNSFLPFQHSEKGHSKSSGGFTGAIPSVPTSEQAQQEEAVKPKKKGFSLFERKNTETKKESKPFEIKIPGARKNNVEVSPATKPEMPKATPISQTPAFSDEDDAKTVVMQDDVSVGAVGAAAELFCIRTGRKMIIDKDHFCIGRDPKFADFLIADNRAVSGVHADIVREGPVFYLIDKKSSNHTYLNGSMLTSMEKYPLNDGDTIRAANEDMRFRKL
ncbi:MAG: DUF6382 domain-containing protein [Lachnospiraceae bacterium]|nr:DUF6382 domain-containing protein [Lachnospiraceae bacterium]